MAKPSLKDEMLAWHIEQYNIPFTAYNTADWKLTKQPPPEFWEAVRFGLRCGSQPGDATYYSRLVAEVAAQSKYTEDDVNLIILPIIEHADMGYKGIGRNVILGEENPQVKLTPWEFTAAKTKVAALDKADNNWDYMVHFVENVDAYVAALEYMAATTFYSNRPDREAHTWRQICDIFAGKHPACEAILEPFLIKVPGDSPEKRAMVGAMVGAQIAKGEKAFDDWLVYLYDVYPSFYY